MYCSGEKWYSMRTGRMPVIIFKNLPCMYFFCITNFIDTVFVCVCFCRFEFVKQLKRKIDEALSPLIEDEIEKFAMAGQVDTSGQETLVSKITQSVIHSKPYVISGL